MAKEEIAYTISVDSGNAGKSLSDLKKEFKEQQTELAKLTIGSKEYTAQLQKLGDTKDDIADLNTTIKAFNPEGKVKALGTAIGGLAGGFAAAQGAMALFGTENKELEKTLIKVQAAMAFQQGIEGLVGLGDAFKVLWEIIKANPLGAIITALALVGAAVGAFIASMDKSSEATKKLNQQVELQTQLVNALAKETDRQVAILKSQGASELEIIAIKQKLAEQQIVQLEQSIALHQSKIRDIRDNNSLEESYWELMETIQRKLGNDKAADQMEKIRQNTKLARAKEDLDAINTEKEQLLDLKAEVVVLGNEKINVQNAATENYLSNLQKEKDATTAHEAEIRALWNESLYNKQQAEINDAYLRTTQKNVIEEEARTEDDAGFQQHVEFKRVITEEDAQRSLDIAASTTDSLANLSNLIFDIKRKNLVKGSAEELRLAKKQFQISKALALTGAVVDAAKAVLTSLASSPLALGPIPNPAGIASLAAVAISSAVNIAKIASTKFNEGATSASGGASIPSLSGASAPNIGPPQQGSTQLNADGTLKTKISETNVIKAVVVETDITATQKRVGSIESNAKL